MLIMDASVIIRMIVEIIQMNETVKTTTTGNSDDDEEGITVYAQLLKGNKRGYHVLVYLLIIVIIKVNCKVY